MEDHDEQDALAEFLELFPFLEVLVLRNVPTSPNVLDVLKNYVLTTQSLMSVELEFSDYWSNDSADSIKDLFILLAEQREFVTLKIVTDDHEPVLSINVVRSILEKNQTASVLALKGCDPIYRCKLEGSGLSRSLHQFEFRGERASDSRFRIQRNDHVWRQVTNEAIKLLSLTRILAAFKRVRSHRLPLEIISYCLTYSVVQSPLWIKEQLDVIIRCLRDRKTLGLVCSQVVPFDKNALFVRCKRALKQL